jgi:hypothetical protein
MIAKIFSKKNKNQKFQYKHNKEIKIYFCKKNNRKHK